MFTKEERTKIKTTHTVYCSLLESGINNSLAKKNAENLIREALNNSSAINLIDYILRLFFGDFDLLSELIDSKFCSVAAIKAFSRSLKHKTRITNVNRILSIRRDSEKIIAIWAASNDDTKKIIEDNADYEAVVEAIDYFNKAHIDCTWFIKKYQDPMTLKRVAIILNRDPNFRVDLYDRYQLMTISNNANTKELMSLVKPEYLPYTISLMCRLVKEGRRKEEVIAAIDKFKDDKIVANYFAIKDILNSIDSRISKSQRIAKYIDASILIKISECPKDKNIAEHLIQWAESKEASFNIMFVYNKTVEKVTNWFPFMTGMIRQLKAIYPELDDLYEDLLDRRNSERLEARKQKAAEARALRLNSELPLAKVAIQSFIAASKEEKNLSAKQYCANTDTDYALFTKYVKVLKGLEDPLYEEYSTIAAANAARAMAMMKTAAETVCNALHEKKGKLSLYEYYTITKFEMQALHRAMLSNPDNFSYSDILLFRKYWEKNRYETPMRIGWFYNDYMKIGDHEVTKEDKDKVLAYMRRLRYPLLIPIYKTIVRKYVAGELEIY